MGGYVMILRALQHVLWGHCSTCCGPLQHVFGGRDGMLFCRRYVIFRARFVLVLD